MIDYDKFEKSLKHLQLQFENYKTLADRNDLGKLEKEAITESVIQRFETCYDSMWKVLKRYLSEELGIADMPNSPKPVLRVANENNLLGSGVSNWFRYADARVDTAHDYSGDKAQDALMLMQEFINDANLLLITMAGKAPE